MPHATDARTVPFARVLDRHGDRPAVLTAGTVLSYRELAGRVAAAGRRLGTGRRLVLVAAANEVEPLVVYLAALAGGHPVVLCSATSRAALDALVEAYDPDVVLAPRDGRWVLDERRAGSAHDLHPDLALLLSTSGTTGSPKLVRLSHENLQANAEAIADYLGITDADRAATTLPMHYCYGLSVVHSHLLRGAGLVLTDHSVTDACFWDLFRRHRGTSFAGVPHTFELLDRVGFDGMRLPHLRYLTQAGGRLPPERVRRLAALGRRDGWDFFVMYGQTEATARMAYLPPALAASHPQAIGVPVPGGSFALDGLGDGGDPEVGELVYRGPNVMMGYATGPADLSLGRTVDQLRTGDLARVGPGGLYEVVGRRSRFVKAFGLRIDLERLETLLAEQGVQAWCVGREGAAGCAPLVVAAEAGGYVPEELRRLAASTAGLPPYAVQPLVVGQLPRLESGKRDQQAVLRLAEAAEPAATTGTEPAATTGTEPAATVSATALRDLYAWLLDRPDATVDDSFVDLGGDSLSYVEISVRLEALLGHLPAGWHTTPVRDLATARRRRRRPGRSVEAGVVLRAVGIVLIVGSHAGLFSVLGSAHVLVAVAGYNYARFRLTGAGRLERLRQQVRSIARVALPSMAWIAAAYALTDDYALANVFLLNGLLGPDSWTTQWHFWFVEVLVYNLVVLAALMAVPWVDRAERRFPFGFVAVLVAFGLLTRFEVLDVGVGPVELHTYPVFWLFVLGWAVARARSRWQRLLVAAVTVAAVPGFFDDPRREAVIAAGVLLLAWGPGVRLPGPLARAAGALASASLAVYLTHWQVYPHLADRPALAVAASLAVGLGYWLLVGRSARCG